MNTTPIWRRNRRIFTDANLRLKKEQQKGIDRLLAYNMEPGDPNFFLLTGTGNVGHFIYSSAIVDSDGTPNLLVAELEEADARRAGLDYSLIKEGYSKDLPRALGDAKRIGVNASLLPLKIAKLLETNAYEIVDISGELENARVVKTREELASMRRACDIACDTALKIPGYIKPGVKEIELAAQIEYLMTMAGGEGVAFSTIVASGANPAAPHHKTGGREFQRGDFVLLDFGCKVNGMHSDITRTFFLGEPSYLQTELYLKVLQVQENCLDRIEAGVDGYKIWQSASSRIERFFERRNMKGQMGHGLGHGLGYFCHDGPRISKVHYKLPRGLITSVEPGGYSEGFGGVRIEDDVIVRNEGVEILTSKAPKDLKSMVIPCK